MITMLVRSTEAGSQITWFAHVQNPCNSQAGRDLISGFTVQGYPRFQVKGGNVIKCSLYLVGKEE